MFVLFLADVKKYKCSACVPASASTSAASSKEPCVAVTDVTLEDTMEVTEQQHFESDSELADSEKVRVLCYSVPCCFTV